MITYFSLHLVVPLGDSAWPLASIEDMGEVVRQIFLDFDTYKNKITAISRDFLTLQNMADILNTHLRGVKFVDSKVNLTCSRIFEMICYEFIA